MIPVVFFFLWALALVATGWSIWLLRDAKRWHGLKAARWYLCFAFWLVLFDGLSSMPFSAGWKVFLYMTMNLSAFPIPVFWVIFALRYAHLVKPFRLKKIVWISAVPALTLLMALTNSWHHLYWRTIDVRPDGALVCQAGPFYYVGYFYTWGSWLILTGVLLGMSLFYKGHRKQTWILLAAALIPWVIQLILLVTNHLHYPGYNFLPVLAGLGSVLVVGAVWKGGFFHSELIAPHQLLESQSSFFRAYLLIGKEGEVLEASSWAIRELNWGPEPNPLISTALSGFPDLLNFVCSYRQEEVAWKGNTFAASLSPILESEAYLLRLERVAPPVSKVISEVGKNEGLETEDLLPRVLDLFKRERAFLDPQLDMNQVCRRLQTNRKTLSVLINGKLGVNFSRFINCYRMQEYERLSKEQEIPGNPQMTVEARALASGFASRSRFYEVQKEFQKSK